MDYGKTLNLPQTDFSMRANLPQKEPQILEKWENDKLFDTLMKKNEGKPLYILHDGPPYANGDIHLGHTLNKILKDIIVREKSMNGYKVPYVPGWDTHGLPIERQAIKKLGINPAQAGIPKFRSVCRDFAYKYVKNQSDQFKRLGVVGDFENPYLTLLPEFEAKQIEMFGNMAKKGLIYKGLKPVYWCADCQTALAEAEIEYKDDKTNTIYVKFPVVDGKGKFDDVSEKVYFVIWTTTTWTLPANLAICLNKDFEYSLVKSGDEAYIFASELVDTVCSVAGITDYSVIKTFTGDELEYITCAHPFLDRQSLVILGDHVTLEAGTGCVHTAPGHGMEDYIVCRNYPEIPIVVPVDAKGVLTAEAGQFEGLSCSDANVKILEYLRENGYLLSDEEIVHSYPHCWRCKHPIIYRATEQWFASVDAIKEDTVKAIKTVKWLPAWGEDRITNMVKDRNDWCISRQRTWGVPIPIFYCKDCGEAIINDETIKIIGDLFREKGSDAWFELDANDILPAGFKCEKCGGADFTKESDIMDVWFDSGSSHGAVLETRDDLTWPADLYLEGNDQYRGWFQSSLLISVANYGSAPYKRVITHGMVVDGKNEKMSKSLGNGIDPLEVIDKNGADILRMWVASSDYKSDVRISKDILAQLSESYRKIRNTARYMLGNLAGFNPDSDAVAYENMPELDKWALMRFNRLVKKVNDAYENFEYHVLYHAIHNFCVVDMSSFYLDIIKDRLYTEEVSSEVRRSAQTVMFTILDGIVKLISPVLAFTSEEIWKNMPHKADDDTQSILFNQMPKTDDKYEDAALEDKYANLIALKNDAQKALEEARTAKVIGKSLDACIEIFADGKKYELLEANKEMLKEILIVSDVKLTNGAGDGYTGEEFGAVMKVSPAEGEKCERCWMFSKTVGETADHPTLCARCANVVKDFIIEE